LKLEKIADRYIDREGQDIRPAEEGKGRREGTGNGKIAEGKMGWDEGIIHLRALL
jgi:hypothetical protein